MNRVTPRNERAAYAARFLNQGACMSPNDSIEFEAVDVEQLRRHAEANEPVRAVFPGGVVFEEIKAGTGAFRKYDPKAGTTLEHSQRIEYRGSLNEQFLASRDNTQPRLPRLEA